MRRVSKSAIVPYSAVQMFELVDDIDSYCEFLPWCRRSEVLNRTENTVEALLELQKGTFSKSFTTRNDHDKYEAIDISLLGGPFRHLSGGWRFQPLGKEGSRVSLELEFEFESRMIDVIFGTFFEEICNSLVTAFTDRAADIYGPIGPLP